jgi:hypothetical protein
MGLIGGIVGAVRIVFPGIGILVPNRCVIACAFWDSVAPAATPWLAYHPLLGPGCDGGAAAVRHPRPCDDFGSSMHPWPAACTICFPPLSTLQPSSSFGSHLHPRLASFGQNRFQFELDHILASPTGG